MSLTPTRLHGLTTSPVRVTSMETEGTMHSPALTHDDDHLKHLNEEIGKMLADPIRQENIAKTSSRLLKQSPPAENISKVIKQKPSLKKLAKALRG